MNTLYSRPVISLETALKFIDEALRQGARRGLGLTVAVVDPSLQLVAFAKSDGAPPDAEALSRRKATSAATMNKPSNEISDELILKLVQATAGVFTNLGGGLPIRFDGQLVGGSGITGAGPQGKQAVAHEIGLTTLAAIGADRV